MLLVDLGAILGGSCFFTGCLFSLFFGNVGATTGCASSCAGFLRLELLRGGPFFSGDGLTGELLLDDGLSASFVCVGGLRLEARSLTADWFLDDAWAGCGSSYLADDLRADCDALAGERCLAGVGVLCFTLL